MESSHSLERKPSPFLNVVRYLPVPGNFEYFPSARANDELARSSDRADAVQHRIGRAGFLNSVLFLFRKTDRRRYVPCRFRDTLRHSGQRGCACRRVDDVLRAFQASVVGNSNVNEIYFFEGVLGCHVIRPMLDCGVSALPHVFQQRQDGMAC